MIILFRCIRWMKRQYSIPAYVWWINIHFWQCNINLRPLFDHWNASIKSFGIWIILSDVSGEWKDNILFLHISGGSVYTLDNVISFSHYHSPTRTPPLDYPASQYFSDINIAHACQRPSIRHTFWIMYSSSNSNMLHTYHLLLFKILLN